jgi:hypothetical protein
MTSIGYTDGLKRYPVSDWKAEVIKSPYRHQTPPGFADAFLFEREGRSPPGGDTLPSDRRVRAQKTKEAGKEEDEHHDGR